MSENTTVVRAAGRNALLVRGHVTRAEAIKQAREHWAQQAAEARAILEAISRGEVRVFHQEGVNVPRNRTEVTRSDRT